VARFSPSRMHGSDCDHTTNLLHRTLFPDTLYVKNRIDLSRHATHLSMTRLAVYCLQPEKPPDQKPYVEFIEYLRDKKRVCIHYAYNL